MAPERQDHHKTAASSEGGIRRSSWYATGETCKNHFITPNDAETPGPPQICGPKRGEDSQILLVRKGADMQKNGFSERTRDPLCAAARPLEPITSIRAQHSGAKYIQREGKRTLPISISPFRPVTPAGPIRWRRGFWRRGFLMRLQFGCCLIRFFAT